MTLPFLSQGNCRLPVVIFILVLKSILEDYRKESPFFPNPTDHKVNLTLSPNVCPSVVLEGKDYGLKVSINVAH